MEPPVDVDAILKDIERIERPAPVEPEPRSAVRTAVTILAVLFFGALAIWGVVTIEGSYREGASSDAAPAD